MSYFTRRQRFKIALGGFLFLTGFMILIFTFLSVTKIIDVENVLQSDLLVDVLAVVGSLDILAAIVLLRFR